MKKRILTVLIGIFIIISMSSMTTASTGANANYLNVYLNYFENNLEYNEVVWNGRDPLRENTVYYVDRTINITNRRIIPATSMLVIRNNGYIAIKDSGSILVRGTLGIEEGGILDMERGSLLVLNIGSNAGVNGGLYVGEGSELRIFSAFYVYTNGLLMTNGLTRTVNDGTIYFVNSIRTFNNGVIRGNRERMSGLDVTPKNLNADMSRVVSMRFYDRANQNVYTLRDEKTIKMICDGLFKIKLTPLRESTPIQSDFDNRFAVRLFDERGVEIFYFERPEHENGMLVYMDGITYTYSDAGMTYDEFYFYAMGVRAFLRR